MLRSGAVASIVMLSSSSMHIANLRNNEMRRTRASFVSIKAAKFPPFVALCGDSLADQHEIPREFISSSNVTTARSSNMNIAN